MTKYKVTNPATGQVEKEFPEHTDDQLTQAIDQAGETFATWSMTSPDERATLLNTVADIYERRTDELAEIIGREMGKPVKQARGELGIVVDIYRYYAKNGPTYLENEPVEDTKSGSAYVQNEPYGVLLGIMPWNFPYYQVARFAAPNLMIGNTVLLKHAQICPESAQAMEDIFQEAGFPIGAYTNIYASNEQVADIIIPNPQVQGVSLTGSDRAGSAVAAKAGEYVKKVVLELGGNDPFLVLDRDILPKAVKSALIGRMGNAGQACNAAKRIIVLEDIYDEFVEQLSEAVNKLELADPADEDTFIGPMSSASAADGLHEQVQDAITQGATVHAGGDFDSRGGAWYQPTMLTGITKDMRAYSEELFGPVAMVYKVKDEDEAVKLANDTPYGLSASVMASDADRARRVGGQIQTGMVFINEPAKTSAELPFGGVKQSGVGRELGRYGMDEFVNKRLIKFAG
ncbi:MAG: NAD-dependent succinate-semialdehyde dehydrogenase [Yaniella sp.]|uniref:NAD-dependent succinate-semialdehyde dehydrogenase n=1 Tax=Yaniella sp. TaxID=2773929 RepID=UPI0026489389|nr:NAD-dependent succinate-semialdehyde dehydrogenase [Yaniella sp.]MDN5818817.1 NAD-dependent succinate-semialdehyde dehydrogenase [Yaniella sp.]MDN5838443.1 NAD-dependent succinate-semialdehyde dehydrogenase [Yaniella sp.]MDN5890237.1 NAD-dependent succinate-semialdehyde dehydrogenase [Yaniella sp.]MDN6149392.1 NAD-dependent succinate-semialdehyde dehydrogenase [Yaniella sp.]MDN6151944.1 NAD-dependent succinate-semialdehyde dehydrogenase [Yaniella sp.]